MADLDFSSLSDDQLVELIRAALSEAARRGRASVAAAQEAWLDEAEKTRVAKEATEREAAKLRAAERERIAREAAERVRREHEARNAQAEREAQRKAGLDAAAAARQGELERRQWLVRTGAILDRDPWMLCLVSANTRYGWRVLVNRENERFARDHLVDYHVQDREIRTVRQYVGKKPELIALLAEFAAWDVRRNAREATALLPEDFDWSDLRHPENKKEASCPTN